jgi:hypothetical protein
MYFGELGKFGEFGKFSEFSKYNYTIRQAVWQELARLANIPQKPF